MNKLLLAIASAFLLCTPVLFAGQPKVNPGPDEPNLEDILEHMKLDVKHDLRNPVLKGNINAHQFVKAGKGPVVFEPILAYGREEATHGGWCEFEFKQAGAACSILEEDVVKAKRETWSFAGKSQGEPREAAMPPLQSGDVRFEPGDGPFDLWISNESFDEPGVFTWPTAVEAANPRLSGQPYKAMIYPDVDAATGHPVANSYIICWEYSDNDDFQDVLTRIRNVRLLPPRELPGITKGEPTAKKIADGFTFTEGPAWNFKNRSLFFSDIPNADIVRYADGKAAVANDESGQSNGLMFDKTTALIACEHKNRRVSRAEKPGQHGKTIVDGYEGKRLNSPNDLWIDQTGGIYFTDPRYGNRDDMEMQIEGVYYVSADGEISRIIDDLVRPNGIALSPDGKWLYVVDNGASLLYRYPVQTPGKIGKGKRIAYTPWPDGMSVDAKGRLYVTGAEGVLVLEPDGKWIGAIASAEQPANCTFGGDGYRTLYITARTGLYAIDTLTRGWHLHLDGPPRRD